MLGVFLFGLTLLIATLISGRAQRSVLSTAVLFLIAGFVTGKGVLGLMAIEADNAVVQQLATLALFSVLFTDGMRVGVRDLTSAWRLPGRALLLGMPLTMIVIALSAHWIIPLPWAESFILGAALSPTDPVFAAAIIGREEIPGRLRYLLNVESGLNDGLALPFVLVLLDVVSRSAVEVWPLLGEIVLGVALGVVVPWIAIQLQRSRFFAASALYKQLDLFAVGVLVLSIAALTHANQYLAAFVAGVTVATNDPGMRDAFHDFGEAVTELLKLAALLVFGALISVSFLADISLSGYLFAVLVLILARPLALALALFGTGLDRREWIVAAWFGPKGFASVVYGLLIWQSGTPRANQLFHLIALVIITSIIAHSSTDVIVARWFDEAQPSAEATESSPQRNELQQ